MESNKKITGNLEQDLEQWLSPIGIQPECGLFSEKQTQQSTQIEGASQEGAKISNQDPEGAMSTMVVLKCSDAIKVTRVKVDGPLGGVLYK